MNQTESLAIHFKEEKARSRGLCAVMIKVLPTNPALYRYQLFHTMSYTQITRNHQSVKNIY